MHLGTKLIVNRNFYLNSSRLDSRLIPRISLETRMLHARNRARYKYIYISQYIENIRFIYIREKIMDLMILQKIKY